jgi:hypothetical protein
MGSVFECFGRHFAFDNRTQKASGKWPFENRTVQISDVDCSTITTFILSTAGIQILDIQIPEPRTVQVPEENRLPVF